MPSKIFTGLSPVRIRPEVHGTTPADFILCREPELLPNGDMSAEIIPDLQACVLCEDVRQEASGQQTLIGIIGMIPAPVMPIGFFKLCLWSRWCGGVGEFVQQSLILTPDDDQPIAQSEVRFSLPSLETHATNVHVFGGIQFQKHGLYTVEVKVDNELRLRFPLPVVPIQAQS